MHGRIKSSTDFILCTVVKIMYGIINLKLLLAHIYQHKKVSGWTQEIIYKVTMLLNCKETNIFHGR